MKPRWFRKLISRDAEKQLVDAIALAERGNRGEVRVHIERRYPGEGPIGRAAELFEKLGVARTRDGTGVLLYVAIEDHKVAVFAGPGIYGAAEPDFWKDVTGAVAEGIGHGDVVAGLKTGLVKIGDLLRAHAPGEDTAGNELPNTVSAS